MAKYPSISALEGAVNVAGSVTPITRRPVTQINAEEWGNMGRTELFNQRQALDQRLSYAMQRGDPAMIAALQQGLAVLDFRLNELYTDDLGML